MFSFKSIVLIAGALAVAESSGITAYAAAPLIASAHVGYAHAVPQNIPPYASQYSYVHRAASPLFAAPFAAPYLAGPAPVLPAPYTFPGPAVAGPLPYSPYAAASPFLRAPFGFAPTFVR